MSAPPKRHRLNVVGDFYVADACCTLCGVPKQVAPMLFDDDNDSCWVKRQPSRYEELELMLQTMRQQEFSCVRYAGKDKKILDRLTELGVADNCDELLRGRR